MPITGPFAARPDATRGQSDASIAQLKYLNSLREGTTAEKNAVNTALVQSMIASSPGNLPGATYQMKIQDRLNSPQTMIGMDLGNGWKVVGDNGIGAERTLMIIAPTGTRILLQPQEVVDQAMQIERFTTHNYPSVTNIETPAPGSMRGIVAPVQSPVVAPVVSNVIKAQAAAVAATTPTITAPVPPVATVTAPAITATNRAVATATPAKAVAPTVSKVVAALTAVSQPTVSKTAVADKAKEVAAAKAAAQKAVVMAAGLKASSLEIKKK
jgi:hypothetical protein